MKMCLGPVSEMGYSEMPPYICLLNQRRLQAWPGEVQRGLMSLRQWKPLDERPQGSIKYHHEARGFYFSLLIVLLTVHTVSLTFLTTLLAPNKTGWARGGGKRGGVGEACSTPDFDYTQLQHNTQH